MTFLVSFVCKIQTPLGLPSTNGQPREMQESAEYGDVFVNIPKLTQDELQKVRAIIRQNFVKSYLRIPGRHCRNSLLHLHRANGRITDCDTAMKTPGQEIVARLFIHPDSEYVSRIADAIDDAVMKAEKSSMLRQRAYDERELIKPAVAQERRACYELANSLLHKWPNVNWNAAINELRELIIDRVKHPTSQETQTVDLMCPPCVTGKLEVHLFPGIVRCQNCKIEIIPVKRGTPTMDALEERIRMVLESNSRHGLTWSFELLPVIAADYRKLIAECADKVEGHTCGASSMCCACEIKKRILALDPQHAAKKEPAWWCEHINSMTDGTYALFFTNREEAHAVHANCNACPICGKTRPVTA